MLSLVKNSKVTRVSNAVAAGTTNVNCASVDMSVFENATAIAQFGTLTASAATGIKWQQSDDDGGSDDWTDIAGSALAITDDRDNDCLISELVRPKKRYVRPVITRGNANAVIDSVLVIQTHPRKSPTTHDAATVAGTEVLTSPAEGTA